MTARLLANGSRHQLTREMLAITRRKRKMRNVENVCRKHELRKFELECTVRGRRKAAACATHYGRTRPASGLGSIAPRADRNRPAPNLGSILEVVGRWMVEPKCQPSTCSHGYLHCTQCCIPEVLALVLISSFVGATTPENRTAEPGSFRESLRDSFAC